MLINLRNAMMAGKRLPYDAEVEFLESTGTQWIDTGVPLKFPISVDMTLAMVSPYGTLASLPVFGFRYGGGSASSKFAIWFSKSQLMFALNYGSYDSIWRGSSVQSGQVVHLRTDGAKLYIDGSLVADGGIVTTSDASNTLTLFQMRDTSSVANRGQCVRYYSCKLYDSNGVLVRDYIPVRKGTVGYLYDRVSGKLFGNAGTGDFVIGPDVMPVEYIESHGTEYIDTGVTSGPSNLEFTIDCTITNTIGTSQPYWTGSGVNSVGGLHYVLEQRGIRTGGGDVGNSIPYTSGERVQIRTYYDEQNRRNVQIGDRYYYGSAYSAPTANLCLLRMVNLANQIGLSFSATVSQSGALVRKFLPVRVGTDATSWEGAMMDTLTRRIYRNAGTGAFSYGNDLKYPIPA